MKYDLNDFIVKYQDVDFITLIVQISKEVQQLDASYKRLNRNDDDNGLTYYREYVGDFLFYLNTGVVPAGIQINGLREFLPIIENLVHKGQFKPEVLNLFK
ncbi:hypothetical protein AQ505_08155 [Pedobacter sp. PACM 27299]|uniref:hypothetical protein n=1 Tax=Pedobacter sp. PACM 27299 TaxID=1727164 RepID=UPI00070682BD|nr:hypothetical protein [Pedobacter sp. PACM 27299]ALL05467.1 hypothetical protein AQ505_08155 [Pedobacter sp. PACM 27299]